MYPIGGKMTCKKCGHCDSAKPRSEPVLQVKKATREINIYTETLADTLPVDDKVECSKCGNRGAYWYLLQTRKADEAETRFYQCTKCGHKWREY